MNDHRKLVQECINKRADNHAELLKKLDKTCERIAKNEPKVWIGIDESKEMRDFVKQVHIDNAVSNQFTIQIFYPLEKGIGQAEKGNEVE